MRNELGLWIDHRKAVPISIKGGIVTTKTIESQMEPHVRTMGGARFATSFGVRDIVSDTRKDAQYKLHLEKYYEQVADNIHEADDIFIFGPGEALKSIWKNQKPLPNELKELKLQIN